MPQTLPRDFYRDQQIHKQKKSAWHHLISKRQLWAVCLNKTTEEIQAYPRVLSNHWGQEFRTWRIPEGPVWKLITFTVTGSDRLHQQERGFKRWTKKCVWLLKTEELDYYIDKGCSELHINEKANQHRNIHLSQCYKI